MNISQLRKIMPHSTRLTVFFQPFVDAMAEFNITTAVRQAMFIAQVAHESGQFRFVAEIASGEAYEGRIDLGNTQPGDGVKYKGHGLIQITGRSNHEFCGRALGVDLINNPELLEQPDLACRSAAWFWEWKGLNKEADFGSARAFRRVTQRINGGFNGLSQRIIYWERAKKQLGVI